MVFGASEPETFWLDFLRSLAQRGPRGDRLMISDAHEGLKGAVTKVRRTARQRRGVPFMRDATARA